MTTSSHTPTPTRSKTAKVDSSPSGMAPPLWLQTSWRKLRHTAMACAGAIAIAACGGGNGSVDAPPGSTPPPDSVALVVSVAGVAAGSQSKVTSSPAGIDCGLTCTSSYPAGTTVTLTAVAGPGERFAAWAGACSGALTQCAVKLDSAKTVDATFAKESAGATVNLAVNVTGAGAVTSQPAGIACRGNCSSAFTTGIAVALTATPDAGQIFAGWGGACSGTVPTCRVPMSDATSVSAAFTAAPPASTIGWSDSAVLSIDGAGKPRVAIDGAGNATMIWLQLDASTARRNVWTSRKPTGGAWSAAALLESVDTDFFELDLAVDATSGRAVAVWRSATTPVIYGRLADATGAWGAATSFTGLGTNLNDLQAGIDANGNAVAVWSQTPAGSTINSIWSSRYSTASGWGGAARVSLAANDRQDLDPSLAVSASGRAFIVWTRNGTGIVASQAEAASGAWSEPTVLAAGVVSTGVGAPRVAADTNGGAMAVWAQGARNASNEIVTNLTSKRFANGAWAPAATALYTPILTGVLAQARMAVNGSGQFAAVWGQPDASIRGVQSSAAGVWSAPLVIRPAVTQLNSVPEIAIDSAGNMFATWAARANTNAGTSEVWLNQFTPASGWAAGAVHQTSADTAGEPRIAMSDRGQAAMGWTRTGIEGSRIISRYFTSGR